MRKQPEADLQSSVFDPPEFQIALLMRMGIQVPGVRSSME
jgi:hypothetical protein